ncbi:hypothetical protein KAT92_06520 [Candidatus Babeliales bacterium]|nr:hypothetical protein [Candidatus Babeliales bacterium]
MDRKEAIKVLETIRDDIKSNFKCPGLCTRFSVSKWNTEIEALNIGINEIQTTIDNQ